MLIVDSKWVFSELVIITCLVLYHYVSLTEIESVLMYLGQYGQEQQPKEQECKHKFQSNKQASKQTNKQTISKDKANTVTSSKTITWAWTSKSGSMSKFNVEINNSSKSKNSSKTIKRLIDSANKLATQYVCWFRVVLNNDDLSNQSASTASMAIFVMAWGSSLWVSSTEFGCHCYHGAIFVACGEKKSDMWWWIVGGCWVL